MKKASTLRASVYPESVTSASTAGRFLFLVLFARRKVRFYGEPAPRQPSFMEPWFYPVTQRGPASSVVPRNICSTRDTASDVPFFLSLSSYFRIQYRLPADGRNRHRLMPRGGKNKDRFVTRRKFILLGLISDKGVIWDTEVAELFAPRTAERALLARNSLIRTRLRFFCLVLFPFCYRILIASEEKTAYTVTPKRRLTIVERVN